jgi:uncharacterized membrane protein
MKLRDIRANARKSLKGHWGVAILSAIIAGFFGASGSSFSSSSEKIDASALAELTPQELVAVFAIFGVSCLIGLAISVVLSSFVSVGYAQFNMDLVDGNEPKVATLFSKFKQIGTTIAANVLVFLHVLIGTILFIVPGIIAAYKFSMVNYIIAENPGISAREALKKSKEIMNGNKMRFFLLGLSFFGWALLVVLTLGIASIWVNPYIQASNATFYREITE